MDNDTSPFLELMAINHREAMRFFSGKLREVAGPDVCKVELSYNAAVLAHFAQTPVGSSRDTPFHSDLTTLFDAYVVNDWARQDSVLMETAGCTCLLLTGFFGAQTRHRHNIRWWSELGAGYFMRASTTAPTPIKGQVLSVMSCNFEPWRKRYYDLSIMLRDDPYVLPRFEPPQNEGLILPP